MAERRAETEQIYSSKAIGIGTAVLRIGDVAANRARAKRRRKEGTRWSCVSNGDRGWGAANGRHPQLESQCQQQ